MNICGVEMLALRMTVWANTIVVDPSLDSGGSVLYYESCLMHMNAGWGIRHFA